MARYAQIRSTGRYVPQTVLTNADVSARLGEDIDEWLIQNVGIAARHTMASSEVTSDLVARAAEEALSRASISAADLDLIIVATDTPDYLSPATAAVVLHKLDAYNAGVLDVNSACSGWVTALDLAARYIMTEPAARYVLCAGGYGMSRYLNWKDKSTCSLFADGAGAVILQAGEEPGFLGGKFMARGQYHDALGIYTGGTARPATLENVKQFGPPKIEFVRKFPKTFNADNWPLLVENAVRRAGLTVDNIDLFLFTQLNLRTIELVMERLRQPLDKTHWIMDKWGYTGSACIPMALDDALHGGRKGRGLPRSPRRGEHVVMCASGGGLAMAASVWRWVV